MPTRADVLLVEVGKKRGTGFLIARDRMLTALHVIGVPDGDAIRLHAETLQIRAATRRGNDLVPRSQSHSVDDIADWIDDFDPNDDWVCIKIDPEPFADVPVRTLGVAGTLDGRDWVTYGFPDSMPRAGKGAGGEIRTSRAAIETDRGMYELMQLYSKEAAAGTGGAVHGFSGAPVVVDGVIVGFLRAAHVVPSSGVSAEGTLYAVSVNAFAERLGVTPEACPYLGAVPFGRHQGNIFCGREVVADDLVRRLRDLRQRRLCVIGPSGSGKSSLIEAGVLARLERESRFRVLSLRPSRDPAAQLRRALEFEDRSVSIEDILTRLLAHSQRDAVLLFVDQLEELFTLCSETERDAFVQLLHGLEQDRRLTIVVALRADFFGHLMESPLWSLFENARYEVGPLRDADLRRAIALPAQRAGAEVDPALIERLCAEASGQAGALPLLQETLLEIWQHAMDRQSRRLTLEQYERLGNGQPAIAAALSRRADSVLANLSASQTAMARRILMTLVSFGDDRAHTRRQESVASLAGGEDAKTFEPTLAALIDGRILTVGTRHSGARIEKTADLSHEALITSWATFRGWIEAGRDNEERRRSLNSKVLEWRRLGDVKLLDAIEVVDAQRWLERDAQSFGEIDGLRELLARSVAQHEAYEQQRDEARRLLATSYEEHGRRLALEGHPMRAFPYLVAAREICEALGPGEERLRAGALKLLFSQVARSLPVATFASRAPVQRACFDPSGEFVTAATHDCSTTVWAMSTGQARARLAHPATVTDLAFSADGQLLATACQDGRCRVWRLATAQLVRDIGPHERRVHIVRFAGEHLVTASWNHDLRIWPAGDSEAPAIFEFAGKISSLDYDPIERRIAVASGERVTVIDVGTARWVVELRHGDLVRGVSFSPDGRRLVTASSDRTARVWDAEKGTQVANIEHQAAVNSATFDSAGSRVLTSSGNTARVWDAASGEPVGERILHSARVTSAVFSSDDKLVATASWDRTCRISDATTGRALCPPLEHSREVQSCELGAGDKLLLTVATDGRARVWNVDASVTRYHVFEHSKKWLTSVSLDSLDHRLLTVGADRTVRLWDISSTTSLGEPLKHDEDIVFAQFHTTRDTVVTASGCHVFEWSIPFGRVTQRLEHNSKVTAVALVPSKDVSQTVATGTDDGSVVLWSLESGNVQRRMRAGRGRAITSLSFSGDGNILLATCSDHKAYVWAHDSGLELLHDDTVTHGCISADGTLIATASKDRTARLWESRSGKQVGRTLRHADEVGLVAFSPDSTRIATMSADVVRVWNVSDGRPRLDPLEHGGKVLDMCFSATGTLIGTASKDGCVRIWDARSGKAITPPFQHPHRVNCLAFDRNASKVITASGDRVARLWSLFTDKRPLAAWRELLRQCPYALVEGVLVENDLDFTDQPTTPTG